MRSALTHILGPSVAALALMCALVIPTDAIVPADTEFVMIRLPAVQTVYIPDPVSLIAAAAEEAEKKMFDGQTLTEMANEDRIYRVECGITMKFQARGGQPKAKRSAPQKVEITGEYTLERVSGPSESQEVEIIPIGKH